MIPGSKMTGDCAHRRTSPGRVIRKRSSGRVGGSPTSRGCTRARRIESVINDRMTAPSHALRRHRPALCLDRTIQYSETVVMESISGVLEIRICSIFASSCPRKGRSYVVTSRGPGAVDAVGVDAGRGVQGGEGLQCVCNFSHSGPRVPAGTRSSLRLLPGKRVKSEAKLGRNASRE